MMNKINKTPKALDDFFWPIEERIIRAFAGFVLDCVSKVVVHINRFKSKAVDLERSQKCTAHTSY